MREILFRGKRKDNNEWAYGGIVHQTDYYGDKCDKWFIIDGTDTQDYEIGYEYEIIPKTVSEWTGLHDKNNVRIFEGDIVKTINKCLQFFEKKDEKKAFIKSTSIGVVCYINGCFEIKNKNGDTILGECLGFDYMDTEVIGNIHDNPELLKE